MNPFWTVSLFWGVTVVCVLIALAFVLPALLRTRAGTTKAGRREVNIAVYQDQMKEIEAERANGLFSEAQFQTAKQELEARLADDALSQDDAPEPARVSSRRLGYTLAAVLPAAAFGLYFLLGNPAALITVANAQSNSAQPASAHPAATGAGGEHDIMKLIQQVEAKTKTNPNDGEAWAILAKAYAAVGHWPEALHAYEKAIKLQPEKPSVMSGYAEALAISNNRVLKGKPTELVLQALEKDPDDLKALELAGVSAFQEQGYAKAAFYMKRLHKLLPPESPYAQDILAAQKEAERLVHKSSTGLDSLNNPPPAENRAAPSTAAAKSSANISGHIDIAPALKSKITDKDVLFLFAKPGQSGPPVAAIRGNVGKFPVEFELNDSMAMNPDNKLSVHKEVTLTARISRTGVAKAQSGDLEGTLATVKVGAKGVKLVINTVRP